MSAFALSGKLLARPGRRDELVDVLLRAAGELEDVPEYRLYLVNVIEAEPDAVWVTELWTSPEAHARSLQKETVRSLIREGRPLIANFVEQLRMTPVGGKGLA